jgi:hypothetical protein
MKNSNLAERLEEFAGTVEALESSEQKRTLVSAFVLEAPRPATPPSSRRAVFGARRILIRDDGLQPFRVS